MSEHTITAKGYDTGQESVTYPVIVRTVRGLSSSYGPGGYAIGIVPAGRQGRRVFQGPMVPGPWGYLYGRASVIDTSGGTARDLAIAASEGRVIDELGHGDALTIEGTRYLVSVNKYSGEIRLDPETGPQYNARLDAEIAAGRAVPDEIEPDDDPAERPITAARFVALEAMAEELYDAYVTFYGDPDDNEMSGGECDMLRRAEKILGRPQTECEHDHSEP